jgi:hypothetical protein
MSFADNKEYVILLGKVKILDTVKDNTPTYLTQTQTELREDLSSFVESSATKYKVEKNSLNIPRKSYFGSKTCTAIWSVNYPHNELIQLASLINQAYNGGKSGIYAQVQEAVTRRAHRSMSESFVVIETTDGKKLIDKNIANLNPFAPLKKTNPTNPTNSTNSIETLDDTDKHSNFILTSGSESSSTPAEKAKTAQETAAEIDESELLGNLVYYTQLADCIRARLEALLIKKIDEFKAAGVKHQQESDSLDRKLGEVKRSNEQIRVDREVLLSDRKAYESDKNQLTQDQKHLNVRTREVDEKETVLEKTTAAFQQLVSGFGTLEKLSSAKNTNTTPTEPNN